MKKHIVIILAALTLACTLSGCQATPEALIVIGKDTEQMIERAQETLPPEQEKLPLTQRYAVKEHLSKRIELDVCSAEPCSIIRNSVEKHTGWYFSFTRNTGGLPTNIMVYDCFLTRTLSCRSMPPAGDMKPRISL